MISAKEVEDAYDLLKAVVTKTPLQLDPYLSFTVLCAIGH